MSFCRDAGKKRNFQAFAILSFCTCLYFFRQDLAILSGQGYCNCTCQLRTLVFCNALTLRPQKFSGRPDLMNRNTGPSVPKTLRFCKRGNAAIFYSVPAKFGKSLMPVIFPPAVLGPEMAAPILWAPGFFWGSFCWRP